MADPSKYRPLAALRNLDVNSWRFISAYDKAVQFLADTEELQALYFSLEHSERNALVELLAAGIAEKELRIEMEERPWAYEKELAERANWAREDKAKPSQHYSVNRRSR